MKDLKQWEEMQEELDELVEIRRILSERIHNLRIRLRQHKIYNNKIFDKAETIAYKMFGKRLKELSPAEFRQYYTERQRERRKRLKQEYSEGENND